MRPIPAPRLGDTHGLLRAINQRDRLRLDEFITEFSIEELFPPGLENALGRTRQFVSFARAAGLLNEDRGNVELTDIGKRYVRASDAAAVFDVAPDQAEWLRRQLRERHMTDSIYHGAAIGLSLYASNPGGLPCLAARLRPCAGPPRPGGLGQREHAREPGRALHDVPARSRARRRREPADRDRHAGQGRAHAADPHVPARPRGPAQPRRARGGPAEGEAEWAARAAEAPAAEEEQPAPPAEAPAPAAAPRRTRERAESRRRSAASATRPPPPRRRRRARAGAPRPAVRHLGHRRARRGDARVLRDQARGGGAGGGDRARGDRARGARRRGDDLRRPARRARPPRSPKWRRRKVPRQPWRRAIRSRRERPRPRRSPRPSPKRRRRRSPARRGGG